MEAYADYQYYIDKYKGNMPQSDFIRLSLQATLKIKAHTFGRVDINNVQEEVKFCTCLLADKLFKLINSEGKASESVGSWSINYTNNSNTEVDKVATQVIKECLSEVYTEDGTPLLYRGC